jgi:hypothetical protein
MPRKRQSNDTLDKSIIALYITPSQIVNPGGIIKKNSKYNWPKLLQEFNASGLTQTQFCESRNLNPKYFSLKRSEMLRAGTLAFEKETVEKIASQVAAGPTIQIGRCQIHCPAAMPTQSIVSLYTPSRD